MSKFEFIPELVTGRDYDPSPGQKFMDNFDAIFSEMKNTNHIKKILKGIA